jgi:hypothetical protein
LDWFKEKAAAEKATAEEKAAAAEHNTFLGTLKGQINDALADDSPQMRAILVTGMAQLFRLQREHAALKTAHDALKKTFDEVDGKYKRVVSASRSRGHESAAPASGVMPAPKEQNQFTTPAGDALDTLARQVMEQRAAKGAA